MRNIFLFLAFLALFIVLFVGIINNIIVISSAEWVGADEKAEQAINEIAPHYKPWFSPIWEPPSGEIESFLFSLQAAIGSLLVGYFVGYYKGRSVVNAENTKMREIKEREGDENKNDGN